MWPILLGAAGFAGLILAGIAELRHRGVLKTGVVVLSAVCVCVGIGLLLADHDRFTIAIAPRGLGVVLSAVFLFLLIFSVLLEIPFSTTYRGQGPRRLITSGTYSLVRHPGFLWLAFLHLSLVLASGSKLLLAAFPFWTIMNGILVTLEDRVFFPAIFGDQYRDYRRQVPFLIPTPTSLRSCVTSPRLWTGRG